MYFIVLQIKFKEKLTCPIAQKDRVQIPVP